MFHRRSLLQGGAAALLSAPLAGRLSAPALAQDSRAATLRFVPQANLSALDPIWTTATVTANHGYYVFDTLYGVDAQGRPRPQMVEGHEQAENGALWRFRLREGLKFHDGSPVRGADVIASLKRWAARDTFGQLLAKVVVEWQAPDDRSFALRLSRPFPLLLEALSKPDSNVAFIMPERLAATDPTRGITEMVGSGPYRFLANEFNSGSRAVYEKFDGYVPRSEPAENSSGGKVAKFRRIEWHIIPDPSTVAAALSNGEIDWWERPHPDLQSLLARSRDIQRVVQDTSGRLALMRLNCLQPPFNDVRVRRAVRLAVNQEDYMRASQGDDTSAWTDTRSVFPRRTPYYQDHADLMPASLDAARKALQESGYANQKVVIINPTDFPDIGPLGQVTADLLQRVGFNVELAESDWGTVIQRRNSREPVERGGWSIFHTTGPVTFYGNPAMSPLARGQGAAGWFGWWQSERAEQLVDTWLYSQDQAEQQRTAHELGRLALDEVATVPLGQFTIRTALRRNLTGLLTGAAPFPWNLSRA
ncbi:ABC transporter substrate-binding protein [Teichococcus cervicalis]|uniref:Tat pathway signal sequence domain protein n=1 Tax=Pseudoroseomonas cervicalis ATCC 49957 TaxID=525371 RepID=D5RLE2_9PROT|nr:ABC transporter substrate-binding protein [Pseudoroseomonas cervicalis]EFH11879.1 Tat pathway signal sequence domain protein [Pseudoroseomonas cervicalis ATCC 49957]